jgi:DNA-binding IclR family transcriptional regulator
MGSGSFEKILQVLDILEESNSGLVFDEIHSRLDAPRSTLYRYLKALTDAGLIASLPNTGYTLGPRIAELDYKMRISDPLVVLSRPVMAELVQSTPGVALLCRLYRNSVLCVHQESHPDAMRSNYERGLTRPLLRGAASRIILAYMPTRTVAKLYEAQPEEFKAANLGETLPEVRAALKQVRQRGWESVEGQVNPGATGIAAPILGSGEVVIGSLSVTLGRVRMEQSEIERIAERISFCANIISNAIKQQAPAPQQRPTMRSA